MTTTATTTSRTIPQVAPTAIAVVLSVADKSVTGAATETDAVSLASAESSAANVDVIAVVVVVVVVVMVVVVVNVGIVVVVVVVVVAARQTCNGDTAGGVGKGEPHVQLGGHACQELVPLVVDSVHCT